MTEGATVQQTRREEQCTTDAAPAVERNRYFTGKPMTARDFTDEQRYFLSRHRLHNRLLHGWGVVCGLEVCPHPRPECRDGWVIVEAGVAIDCCGRELILPGRTAVELVDGEGDPVTDEALICIRYEEEAAESGPVLYSCDPGRREPGRTRELPRLETVPLDAVPDGCWSRAGGSQSAPVRDDCGEGGAQPAGDCLEPSCPCEDRVPLARIAAAPAQAGASGQPSGRAIDDEGVRRIAPPRSYLTRVSAINWEHGGQVSLADLDGLDRSLKVWFDRPLRDADGEANGVNAFTFAIQYATTQGGLEFLQFAEPPGLADDGRAATFRIDDGYFDSGRGKLVGSDVFVSLKCDFILDCHGVAVDGDHLRGRLPSGDGVEGGTFESWFRVVAAPTGGGY